jgi:hypothetical protein
MFGRFKAKSRLDDQEERFLQLERRFEGLELDWLEVYSKLKKTMGRIVKTEGILRAKEADAAGDVEEAPLPGEATVPGFLTPKQKLIQQQILQRRAKGGNSRAVLPG